MANPSLAECHTQFANRAALLEKARLAGITQSNNWIGLQDTDAQAQEGDYSGAALAASDRQRARLASMVADDTAAEQLGPVIQHYGIVINSPRSDPAGILDDLHEYMADVAVAAQGTLTLDTQPTDGDTMTIGAITYRFKTAPSQAEDIFRGADLAACQASIIKTLNGTGEPGVDFYAGSTTPHTTVKCGESFAANVLTLTARAKGTAGDALATTETFTAGSNVFDDTTLGATTAGVAALTVQSRVMSFGNVAAGAANVGSGTILRLTKDYAGFDIESGWADDVTVECLRGAQEGASKHQEEFQIRGEPAGIDRLAERGAAAFGQVRSAIITDLRALSALDSERLLVNPSFSSMVPATDAQAVTSLTGWTDDSGSLTNLQTSVGDANDEYYRDYQGDTAPKALDLRGERLIYQVLKNQIDFTRPHLLQLAYKPENSADGLLAMRLRSYTTPATPGPVLAMVNVVVTGSGWKVLRLALGASCWPRIWAAANDIGLEIQWNGRSAGNVILDDVIFAPMTQHDGLWYAAVGGTTRFVKYDVFTFDDSETGAICQRWVHRGWRKHLPHVNGTETITEPTVT